MATKINYSKLDEKAQSVLRTLCSNYRGDMRVKAQFQCYTYYGIDKFTKEITKSLNALKKLKCVNSFSVGAEDIDEETEIAYFDIYADMAVEVEEMAEIAINSQTVFIGR